MSFFREVESLRDEVHLPSVVGGEVGIYKPLKRSADEFFILLFLRRECLGSKRFIHGLDVMVNG